MALMTGKLSRCQLPPPRTRWVDPTAALAILLPMQRLVDQAPLPPAGSAFAAVPLQAAGLRATELRYPMTTFHSGAHQLPLRRSVQLRTTVEDALLHAAASGDWAPHRPYQLRTALRNDGATGRACITPTVPPHFLEAFVAIAMPPLWVHVSTDPMPRSPLRLRPGLPAGQDAGTAAVHILITQYYNHWAETMRLPYDTSPQGAMERAFRSFGHSTCPSWRYGTHMAQP